MFVLRIVKFCEKGLSIYGDMGMIILFFLHWSIIMLNYIDRFLNINLDLHLWNKSYYLWFIILNVLLDTICYYYLRIFIPLFISNIVLIFFSFMLIIWFGIRIMTSGLIKWGWICFLCFYFLKEFSRICMISFEKLN